MEEEAVPCSVNKKTSLCQRSSITLECRIVFFSVLTQPDPSLVRMGSLRCFCRKIKFCSESKVCSCKHTKIEQITTSIAFFSINFQKSRKLILVYFVYLINLADSEMNACFSHLLFRTLDSRFTPVLLNLTGFCNCLS